ncbi:hypothetical protein N657DRAFT_718176 [Parathielavia appendiculata]|uniref:Uncharacterized protein n=1 Tax=Parathielavia appendiculata TaxID=2587402 RepID=A0AAN6TYG8_9PEZI|nr:hypothetical protein N657DRAFT_718176 [Parathielavia appendiculata]
MFWDTKPPPQSWFMYYAAQLGVGGRRAGLNAALLQKIAAAVSHDTKLPIRVHAQPSTYEDAMDNLLAFSDEGRQRQQVKDSDAETVSSIPRMKKRFGWLKIDGGYLCSSLPGAVRPVPVRLRTCGDREILPHSQYFATVYE